MPIISDGLFRPPESPPYGRVCEEYNTREGNNSAVSLYGFQHLAARFGQSSNIPLKKEQRNELSINPHHNRPNRRPTPAACRRAPTEFLRVGRDFTTWIKGRISKYGFAENVDFSRSPVLVSGKNQGLSFGGENRTDYFLTLDMAKELCMVEKSEIGRQARRYFIEMERVAKQGVNREYVALLESQNQALKTELARLAPKFVRIAFYHNVGLDMQEMRLLTQRSDCTVRRNLQRLDACGFTEYRPDPYLSALGKLGNLRKRQNAEFIAAQQTLGLEG